MHIVVDLPDTHKFPQANFIHIMREALENHVGLKQMGIAPADINEGEQTPTNTQSAAIAKIAAEMEGWGRVVFPKPGKAFLSIVRKWARQLRAFLG